MQLWLDICCSWGYAPVVDKLPDLALFIWIWAIPCRNEIEPGQVRSLLLAQLCANYVFVFIETAKQIWVFVYILQAAAHNGTMYGEVIG